MDEDRIKESYHVECFTSREAVNLPERIQKATRRVHILTTSLDYARTFLKDDLRIALEQNKSNTGFRIVMLTLDPEGDATNGRAEQLGRLFKEYRDELRDALAEMVETFGDEPKVDIMIYRTMPTQSTYIIDQTAINSVVALGILSRDGLHFVIENNPSLLNAFHAHFGMLRSVSDQVNKRPYVSPRHAPASKTL